MAIEILVAVDAKNGFTYIGVDNQTSDRHTATLIEYIVVPTSLVCTGSHMYPYEINIKGIYKDRPKTKGTLILNDIEVKHCISMTKNPHPQDLNTVLI